MYKLTPSVQKIYDYMKKAGATTPKMIIDNTDDETMASLEPVLRAFKKMKLAVKKDGKWHITPEAEKLVD